MSIEILSVSPAASEQIGRTLARAFRDAPDYAYILARHPDKTSALTWFFGSFASQLARRYGRLFATPDHAAAILTFAPGCSPSIGSVLRAGLLRFPLQFGWHGTLRAMLLGAHMEKRRLQLAPMPHWYVVAVGVAPEQQGRGLGYALVSDILQRADQERVPCYLEAFEDELVTHYQRRGFVVLQQEHLPNGLHLRYLLRPAPGTTMSAM